MTGTIIKESRKNLFFTLLYLEKTVANEFKGWPEDAGRTFFLLTVQLFTFLLK